MKAGKLDRRVVIVRAGPPIDNGVEAVPGAEVPLATRWASWRPSNGREVFEAQGLEARAGGTFWLRWDSVTSGILPTDRVLFEDRLWDIKGVQEIGRRDGIELIVAAGDEGDG
jgi:head-tail adaptor